METYIDGFVIPVPLDKLDAYKAVATQAAAIWTAHGALEYRECVGDDLDVKDQLPFPKLAATKPGETVVFAYIVYPSRQARDEINAKVMADPRIDEMCSDVKGLFDCSRMAYGGFRTLVEAKLK